MRQGRDPGAVDRLLLAEIGAKCIFLRRRATILTRGPFENLISTPDDTELANGAKPPGVLGGYRRIAHGRGLQNICLPTEDQPFDPRRIDTAIFNLQSDRRQALAGLADNHPAFFCRIEA